MTESTDASINPATMFDTWMKSVNNFWPKMATPFPLADDTGKNATSKTSNIDFWKTGMETWQSIASAMSQAAPAPVRIGDTITAVAEIIDVNTKKNRVILKTACYNQEGTTVIDGEAVLSLSKKR